MKLIHVPTGEEREYSPNIAAATLKAFPHEYIRAELPQYWRVGGYEKSWEWLKEIGDTHGMIWPFVCNYDEDYPNEKAIGFNETAINLVQIPQISRAEFEYHIYKPWKDDKSELKFKRETPMPWAVDPADEIFKPVREFKNHNEQLGTSDMDKTFSPSTLYKHMAENHNVTLLGSQENDIKQIVLNDLDTLKQQAEKMGYELVEKTIKWHMGRFAFTLYMDGDCMIEDKLEDESFRVSVKMAEEIIEKYKQFKSYERI
jgi:hypothetical protein